MLRTIVDPGINWNWYLCGDFNEEEKTVHIYYYDRWHKYEDRGSKHPKVTESKTVWPYLQFMEREGREVYGVKVGKVEYLVTNPANVFSYRDMSVYMPED